MRSAIAALVLGTLLLSGCVPPEESNDRIPRYNEETLMGQIQRRGQLVVGYDPIFAPFTSGEALDVQGLAADLAREVAESLGVEASFVAMNSVTMLSALQEHDVDEGIEAGEIDLGFPLVPLTEELVRQYSLSNPYYVSHQRLLVPSDSPIATVDDLNGKEVCAISDETTVDLAGLNPELEVLDPGARALVPINFRADRVCFSLLSKLKVDAVTGPEILLLGAVNDSGGQLEIVGERLNTAGYGAAAPPGSATFAAFVSTVFGEAKDEGRWMTYYSEWIAPLVNEPLTEPPDLGVTEAAALYPSGLN